ncbi:40S ribosomal protein S13 [Symbiodinium microadriaticum]|uniref:40S ribosomal protein S13 n=1 Tax=Symbiodinium microadriaticum TaxID=2951 RepID=A0A1Q9DQK5_SYMMI|nr:40S ribosomal protein S13 [Symbiodinium microadriaticum]
MGRMYGRGKGIASSAIPYKRTPPTWLKMKPEDVCDHICKLAKKGLTPSQIGVTLRDSFGVPQVKNVTGNHILRILKTNGLAPTLPEDLYYLIKKAVSIRKHLDKNRKDKDAKFRLILVESRIHRLARYYKRVKSLPATWKYVSATASALAIDQLDITVARSEFLLPFLHIAERADGATLAAYQPGVSQLFTPCPGTDVLSDFTA